MASPIDHHPFAPRLGSVVCTFCGQRAEHENHETEPAKKQAALDKYLTDTAREIAPKLRGLGEYDQQTAVTIALELARARVTMRPISMSVDAESFRRAADELAADVGRTLHAYAKHAQIREVDRTLKDGRLHVTRMREVVCARCERLYCPELGDCPCSKTCCQNGPRLGCPVHGEALRSHLEETEKRHRSMASPEAEAAARRDHGDGDGRIPGRPECPSNECQIRQTCTGHAGCTAQYPSARVSPPPHPTTPCIGCNPLRPCFNGWKACQRESDPIASLAPPQPTRDEAKRLAVYFATSPDAQKAHRYISEPLSRGEDFEPHEWVVDAVWSAMRSRSSPGYTAIGFEVTTVPTDDTKALLQGIVRKLEACAQTFPGDKEMAEMIEKLKAVVK